MRFKIRILGSSGAIPAYGRFPSAQLVELERTSVLLDCGEGAQMRLQQIGASPQRISVIAITHTHGDHILGLPGLINTLALIGRTKPLTIIGPPTVQTYIDWFEQQQKAPLSFSIQHITVDPTVAATVYETSQFTIQAFPLQHRGPTVGYRIDEVQRTDKMREGVIEQFAIPFTAIPEIKAGGGWVLPDGKEISHEDLTLSAPAPRSYAYCTDTLYFPELVDQVNGVTVLFHDATFMEAHAEQAQKTRHSTARQAALIARKAKVSHLLLGHFSARYADLDKIAEEARSIFPRSSPAVDLSTVEVTWPDSQIVIMRGSARSGEF